MMRTGSLSDAKVIGLITRYFVPVWVSRDHYQLKQPSKAERAELLRIDRNRALRKMPSGGVCVMVVSSTGEVIASQTVHKACEAENLEPLLKKIVETRELEARKINPAKPVIEKETPFTLHVLTRFEGARSKHGLGEDWIALSKKEVKSFLPKSGARIGEEWEAPKDVRERLFKHFYPPSPNWKVADSKILKSSLKLRAQRPGLVRMTGFVQLSHPFGGKNTPGVVKAKLVGFLKYDVEKETITSWYLVSQDAKFTWSWRGKDLPERMSLAVLKQGDD